MTDTPLTPSEAEALAKMLNVPYAFALHGALEMATKYRNLWLRVVQRRKF